MHSVRKRRDRCKSLAQRLALIACELTIKDPNISQTIEKNRSDDVCAVMSPNPTVEIVVIAQ